MSIFLQKKGLAFYLITSVVFVLFGLTAYAYFIKPASLIYEAPAKSGDEKKEEQNKVEIPPVTHIKTPEAVRGIYMTSWVASTKDFRASLVKIMETTEVNAVVIDVKDYTGKISFEVKDESLRAVGSWEARTKDLREFISLLHEKNIYVIARISVFQDPFLAKKYPELAVKRKNGEIWKDRKGISWADPCSQEVWDYNIKIGKEAVEIGFDELNFDYVRFASDGVMTDIVYPHCVVGSAKADNLEKFFAYLKENTKSLNVPISADLFGMVTTNTDDLGIGQVLEKAAPHFDYICPMVYPSHYPPKYNGYKNPALYPYEVIKLAMDTASTRLTNASSSPAKIRPWLQDFDMGADYTAEMIIKEKQAVYDAGLNSWLMWSPSNKYTTGALEKE